MMKRRVERNVRTREPYDSVAEPQSFIPCVEYVERRNPPGAIDVSKEQVAGGVLRGLMRAAN
jgi:hypothetical protein